MQTTAPELTQLFTAAPTGTAGRATALAAESTAATGKSPASAFSALMAQEAPANAETGTNTGDSTAQDGAMQGVPVAPATPTPASAQANAFGAHSAPKAETVRPSGATSATALDVFMQDKSGPGFWNAPARMTAATHTPAASAPEVTTDLPRAPASAALTAAGGEVGTAQPAATDTGTAALADTGADLGVPKPKAVDKASDTSGDQGSDAADTGRALSAAVPNVTANATTPQTGTGQPLAETNANRVAGPKTPTADETQVAPAQKSPRNPSATNRVITEIPAKGAAATSSGDGFTHSVPGIETRKPAQGVADAPAPHASKPGTVGASPSNLAGTVNPAASQAAKIDTPDTPVPPLRTKAQDIANKADRPQDGALSQTAQTAGTAAAQASSASGAATSFGGQTPRGDAAAQMPPLVTSDTAIEVTLRQPAPAQAQAQTAPRATTMAERRFEAALTETAASDPGADSVEAPPRSTVTTQSVAQTGPSASGPITAPQTPGQPAAQQAAAQRADAAPLETPRETKARETDSKRQKAEPTADIAQKTPSADTAQPARATAVATDAATPLPIDATEAFAAVSGGERADALTTSGQVQNASRTAAASPQHIAQQLAQAMPTSPDQPVEVSLSPEELGKVRLTLHSHDGAITVNVQAERPETLDLMRRNIDSLARDFREMGYSDISFDFGQQTDQRQSAQDRAEEARLAMPETGTEPERPVRFDDAALAIQRRATASGGLDLRF
ncbi:hypothetical protein CKO11_06190 [Rhodobacter sp. TJ_12]|uniref:flagellar hook-length control protein FliK n=1 Tax=Rhodobacter sp. TJ_12 TaxID=2029399 RepID=UPI001CBCEA9D|nr:flagellar hook-length control protein FliK [Rhodobacter sp. TJ_12]MBZ4022045.1 hypothetical protein [Rhodobacter sp. TJ_12]